MWCLKIWLSVIVVLVTYTSIDASQKLDLKRHGKARMNYSCKHSGMCKHGGTCISYGKRGWFRKCICADGWTGRRCKVPIPIQACRNRKFCKNGGSPVCSGRSRRSCTCICTDGWTGRRCDEITANEHNDENKDFISVLVRDDHVNRIPSNIFMTTDTSTSVNITTSETLPEDHITKFNSSITIPYPDFPVNGSSDLKAIRILSADNISVALSVHHDITTLITTEKLGTSYILSTPYNNERFQVYSAITITAIHDNTTITISNWGENTFPDYTLNAFETHVLEYYGTYEKRYNIQSSKPVAVFSGLYCMSDASCSNMVEQIPPYNQLDTVYILPPNYDRVGTLYLFLSQENTTATYPNNETKTIIAGREYGFSKRLQATVIRSADPILMTSYALEYVRNPEERAYWTVVPGVNQYLPRYKVMIPNGWDRHYVALMIRKSAVGGLRVNDQSIDTNTIRFEENVFVEDLEYSVIIAEVREGELTLESIDDTPFGLMAYGNREHGGYGFAGNVVLR